MTLAAKIKQQYSYTVGTRERLAQSPSDTVVLSCNGSDFSIVHWPDANPPTIAEIEAIVIPFDLPAAKSAKQAALNAWWDNHPGVTITAGGQTVTLSVQKADVALNETKVLRALVTQSDAVIIDKAGSRVTIAAANLATAFVLADTAVNAEFDKFDDTQAAIHAASNEEEINAVAMPVYP